ncbi:peptidase S8/S53 domain-containing protein [Mariannaea sp. PMI_226]|nr:peptidase S8/S53 domain-containing protein [Mariannaea sp. PMI_226]
MSPRFRNLAGLLYCILVAISAAKPVVLESLNQLSAGWEASSSAASDRRIKLSIGLQPNDPQLLERTLYQVSDPSHPKYGKHLSRDEAKALLSPPNESTLRVKRWLFDAGVSDDQVSDDGHWIHVYTTVDEAAGLLATRFGVVTRDDEHAIRATGHSVPREIRDCITTIQSTTYFQGLTKARDTKSTKRRMPIERNPPCLRQLYKLPTNNFPDAHNRALYGIIGFDGQAAQFDQLQEFQERFDHAQRGRNFSVALVNGGSNLQGEYPSGEANLNIQYATSLAGNVPVTFFSVGGANHNFIPDLDLYDRQEAWIEPFLELTRYLINLEDNDLPQVISISYSINEQHVPMSYAKEVCNMFGVLGVRGVSVIVAAGNRGPGAGCMSNDGKNVTKFIPSFPSSCPYVTSVGGTDNFGAEIAANFSSGGFSEHWPRPWWQESAVKHYVKKHGAKWKSYYNVGGRGFPDVAALALDYQVMNHGEVQQAGGTSSASPVFGSMIALINSDRMNKGKPPMGFFNPWIYGFGIDGFKDITEGKSAGCAGTSIWRLPSPVIPQAGWKAAKGWDPVTGLGTPLFDQLRKLAL